MRTVLRHTTGAESWYTVPTTNCCTCSPPKARCPAARVPPEIPTPTTTSRKTISEVRGPCSRPWTIRCKRFSPPITILSDSRSSTTSLNKNKYLFSGKELQDGNLGGSMLGLYDFGARHYDSFIGRWLTVDLYAKAYPNVSPYNYCLNNPVNLVDLLGLSPTKIDSVADGKGGWYYVYELEEITVTAPKDQDNPHHPIFYIPSWDFGPVGSINGDNLGPINENFGGGGGKNSNPSKTHPVIDNTWQALVHYFRGKGVPVHIGDNTTKRLLQHPDFVAYHHKILDGTITSKNEFSIDMTYEIFHIGRTNVEYEFNQDDRSVTYQLFFNDGFWDPDFIDEYFLGDKSMYFRPDGMGPNLERFGGQPYPYIPRTVIVK